MGLAPVAPKEIRYIKLGRGGCWESVSLTRSEIHFGEKTVPHEPCLAGAWEDVGRLLAQAKEGGSQVSLRRMVREIMDFYTLGCDCLWITFAGGYLWWAFAEPEVIWLGPGENGQGARMRKTLGGWRNTDLLGNLLKEEGLSTSLTRLKAYRRAICSVQNPDYLLRRINGEPEPLVAEALKAQKSLLEVADRMIKSLHWRDFERLVDLIFARSGWQRVSDVGGNQKDIDIALEQAATGERACVQVKSEASRATLIDYVERCLDVDSSYDRLFFVCHSPREDLALPGESDVQVWSGPALAAKAIKAGLFEWLVGRHR